eukprot:909094-Pelagomonas_calceolata.AAC.4
MHSEGVIQGLPKKSTQNPMHLGCSLLVYLGCPLLIAHASRMLCSSARICPGPLALHAKTNICFFAFVRKAHSLAVWLLHMEGPQNKPNLAVPAPKSCDKESKTHPLITATSNTTLEYWWQHGCS